MSDEPCREAREIEEALFDGSFYNLGRKPPQLHRRQVVRLIDRRLESLLEDRERRALERAATIAEGVRHPEHDASDWSGTKRGAFYKNHIVHAWIQAAHEIARRIRAVAARAQDGGE